MVGRVEDVWSLFKISGRSSWVMMPLFLGETGVVFREMGLEYRYLSLKFLETIE